MKCSSCCSETEIDVFSLILPLSLLQDESTFILKDMYWYPGWFRAQVNIQLE